MSFFGGGAGGGGNNWGSNAIDNPNNDTIVSNPPTDAISSISWNPNQFLFAAASWDSQIGCWSVNQQGQTEAIKTKMEAPVLAVTWSPDGQHIISGGCDKTVRIWGIQQHTNPPKTIGQHDAPVKCVRVANNILISGSWDKSVRFWDPAVPNNNNQICKIDNKCKIFDMDFNECVLITAGSDKLIRVYDIRNPTQPVDTKETTLKHQVRCVSLFPDAKGYAVGSIEGRVQIQYISQNDGKDFAFKCHRNENSIYAINSIRFHYGEGSFATVGSDGGFTFWDKDSKQRLKAFQRMKTSITDCCFSHDGSIFAYATSYDWSQGIAGHNPNSQKPQIYLHTLKRDEISKK